MSSNSLPDDSGVTFYVGHHESRRRYVITEEILNHAQDHNYDMLTTPITNDTFHSRVLSMISAHFRTLEDSWSASRSIAGLADIATNPALTALNIDDTSLGPSDPVNQLIVTVSPWIDLASPDPVIAEISRQVLVLEASYAHFCGASNILIQGPSFRYGQLHTEGLSNYARAIQDALNVGGFLQIQIFMPMSPQTHVEPREDIGDLSKFARPQYTQLQTSSEGSSADNLASWDAWSLIRSVCRYHSRLSVALTIPRNLPPQFVQSRWFSEPLRILNIPGSSFQQNSRSETSLTLNHKQLLFHYMRLRNPPWILLSDVGPLPGFEPPVRASNFVEDLGPSSGLEHSSISGGKLLNPTPAEASKTNQGPSLYAQKRTGVSSHLNYIRQLQQRQPSQAIVERFGAGYQDYLQNPLQPLTDNLESITYEVFEKDPIKYDWYEKAITEALKDWSRLGKPGSGANGKVVVVVAGAGRGPLVTRALQASTAAHVDIDMWAVEKNHNAFVLLQRHNIKRWNGRVSLVQSDMRTWKGPAKTSGTNDGDGNKKENAVDPSSATDFYQFNIRGDHTYIDILVSELLGSFGDNELSPECLDGIQHLLNPTHGISIPSSYTAHLTPISSPKIHADIQARIHSGDGEAGQIPYVVMLQATDYLSTSPPPKTTGAPIGMPQSTTSASGDTRDTSELRLNGNSLRTSSITEAPPIILQAWEFSHPLPPKWLQQATSGTMQNNNMHNERFAWLEFPCQNRGLCHGLAGYFEAVLYAANDADSKQVPSSNSNGNADSTAAAAAAAIHTGRKPVSVELSTHPRTMAKKSQDMISWFPIYFPLKTPLYIPDSSLLAVSMWRKTDGRGVWYEWLVESFLLIEDAAKGTKKRIRLGASELHSSAKNACLM